MTLACPTCSAQYTLDESRIPAAGVQLRCPKCGTTFAVTKQSAQAARVPLPASGQAAPLPAPSPPRAPAPVALPAASAPPSVPVAPPSVARPRIPTVQGSVPLPGSAPAPRFPSTSPATPPAVRDARISLPGGSGAPRSPGATELDAEQLFGPELESTPETPAPFEEAELDLPDVDLDFGAPGPRVVETPASLDLGADLGVTLPTMAAGTVVAPPPRALPVQTVAPAQSQAARKTEPLEVLDPAGGPARPVPSLGRSKPKSRKFQIRRASGKIFGPFEEERILKMLADGDLSGTETIKGDDGDFVPLASVEPFAAAIPGVPSAPKETALAPPGPAQSPEAIKRLQQVYGNRMAGMTVVDRVPFSTRIRAFLPLIFGVAAGLVFLAFGFALGLTTFGVFGRFAILGPPRTSASSPAGAAVRKARAGLHTGTFASLKAAFADAEAAHHGDPLAVDAVGLMVETAAALTRESPGDGATELTRARAALPGALSYGPKDPDVLRAQAALKLTEGQAVAARPFLERAFARQKDAETQYLFAQSFAGQEPAKAAANFQKALSLDASLAKAEVALADLAVARGALDEAASAAQKAIALDANQARARLLLQETALSANKPISSDELRSLAGEKSGLSVTQRATALAFLGASQVAAGQGREAESTLDDALKLQGNNREAALVLGRLLLAQHRGAEALKVLQPLAALTSKDIELAQTLAEAQIDQSHYAEAAQTVAPMLAAHPEATQLATLKGIAAASLGKSEEAEAVLLAAIKADPKSAEAPLALGRLYLSSKRPAQAKAQFDLAVQLAPDSARAHVGLAEFYLGLSQREDAKRELAAAIVRDPGNAQAHLMLGRLLREMGQREQALAELRKAQTLDPLLPRLAIEIGEVLVDTGAASEASKSFLAATEANPKDAEAFRLLGKARRIGGDVEGSLSALRTSENLDSQSSAVHAELALSQLAKGENAQALLESKTAAEQDAQNPDAWRALGRVQLVLGDDRSALDCFDKSAALVPTSADTQALRGQALSLLGNLPEAIAAEQKALALDPTLTPLLLEVGQLEQRRKAYDAAIKDFNAALDTKPPTVEAYYLIARALDEEGKAKEAVRFYELSTKFEPKNAMPYRYLGYFYKGVGQAGKARAAFETYLQLRPDADDKDVVTEELGYLKKG